MARFACDSHGGAFRGRATYFYPAVTRGLAHIQARLRECPDCATRTRLELDLLFPDRDLFDCHVPRNASNCVFCSRELDARPVSVYVTHYEPGDLRVDSWGLAHASCLREAAPQSCGLFGHLDAQQRASLARDDS